MEKMENIQPFPEQPSPGDLLRKLREEKGLTLEAASEATRVKIRYLVALETEDLEALLGLAYAKSFLKAYARLLDADQELVEEYKELISAEVDIVPNYVEDESEAPVRRTNVFLWGLAAIAVTAIVVVLIWELPEKSDMQGPASEEFPSAIVDSTPFPPRTVSTLVPVATPRLTLQIIASDTTWVEVSADGKARQSETLNPGHIRLIDAENEFLLTLGNAGGVELKLNGRIVQPLGKRGEVVRGVVINENSIVETAQSG